jgi:hybrid cluster-associated redox disulfide protein
MEMENNMKDITADMTIGEALNVNPDIVPVLMQIGMHCIGCPASMGETIEEAAMVHGIDVNELLDHINMANDEKEDKD